MTNKKEKIPFDIFCILCSIYIGQSDLWKKMDKEYDSDVLSFPPSSNKRRVFEYSYKENLLPIDAVMYWERTSQGFVFWDSHNYKLGEIINDYCNKHNKGYKNNW